MSLKNSSRKDIEWEVVAAYTLTRLTKKFYCLISEVIIRPALPVLVGPNIQSEWFDKMAVPARGLLFCEGELDIASSVELS